MSTFKYKVKDKNWCNFNFYIRIRTNYIRNLKDHFEAHTVAV